MDHTQWDAWQFLIGEWAGEGGGEPGQGAGVFTLSYDLQERILVRRNRVDYPAAQDRPAFFHEDLTIIYPAAAGTTRAIYFDNEGHVIHYAVEFVDSLSSIVFLSDRVPGAPRFRLTYLKAGEDEVNIRFEIAPPDQPDAFARYTEGVVQRK
jgi:hypothetical protein